MKKITSLAFLASSLILFSFQFSINGGLPDIYMINPKASSINWKMVDDEEKTTTGTIEFKSGNLKIDTKQIVGGFAYVNMQTLACNSIEDAGFNKAKVDEMRSAEVMNVVKYKEMTFKIIKAIRKDVPEGQPNYDITMQVGLKGLKKNVQFPAVVDLGKKATSLTSSFVLDHDIFSLPHDIEMSIVMETTLKK